uniref:L-2-hydroxyglutarate dehydrogenase, mitochondrial n=1 Tax=Brassica campestris TaxID=3711 RepID=M4CST3_BRACM
MADETALLPLGFAAIAEAAVDFPCGFIVAEEANVFSLRGGARAECVHPVWRIGSVKAESYRFDSSTGTIGVGDLYAEEERNFLVNLDVPVVNGVVSDPMSLLKVRCVYRDPVTKETVGLSSSSEVKILRPVAKFCVRGRELLYRYCSEHGIAHRKIGKLVVATGSSDIPKLDLLMHLGTQNGVSGLRMLEGFEAMRMEPELRCVKALLSPESGIVDTHSFMLSLVGQAENSHATFSYNTVVLSGRVEEEKMHLFVAETGSVESRCEGVVAELELIPNLVVNSAGLGAQALAKRFHGLGHRFIPSSHYARGCYFTLSGAKSPPFDKLVYPIPEEGGLGVHVTVDLNGLVKFGPDVEWIECRNDTSSFLNKFDYGVNPQRAERFYPEIRKYYPKMDRWNLVAQASVPRLPDRDRRQQTLSYRERRLMEFLFL